MAAAARSNPADARVPCPLCGGLIHPIAGRCKHCKGDLSALRSSPPAAAAALPALHALPAMPVAPYQNGNGHANGRSYDGNGHRPAVAAEAAAPPPSAYAPNVPAIAAPAVAPVAMPQPPSIPVPFPQAYDGGQILPPRPTGRMHAHAGGEWWKSWPLIVIVIAGLAIVVAAVLMALPRSDTADPTNHGGAPANKGTAPAPERMDTNPLPPRSGDPWNGKKPSDPATRDPATRDPGARPRIDIPDDPTADPDPTPSDPDPDDPTFGGLSSSGAIVMTMMRHACDRAASCGALEQPIQDYCEMAKKLPAAPPPATCPAAQRCYASIDSMSCTAGFDDIRTLSSVMHKFQDCVEAISC